MKHPILPTHYETDFYGWTQWQADVLIRQQASELDWHHLHQELESLGKQEYRELVSRLTVLIGHLLKWQVQPENRCRSWFLTIREQRRALRRHLYRNPSLRSRLVDALEDGFEAGVDLALRETQLPLRVFPDQCPYLFEEILSDSFCCDTRQDFET